MPTEQTQPVPYAPPVAKPADQKFCYGCGALIHVSATECPRCGARQPDLPPDFVVATTGGRGSRAARDQVFCRACGGALHPLAPVCPHCGAPQAPAPATPSHKSKVVAALLAFFLGGFGVHKFYLGQTALGVIYLLFCWTFIPALVAVIEGIVYLTMSDERFAGKYG